MGMFRVMTPGGRRGGRLLGGERRPAVAVLDIGSTKICAVIARLPAPGLCQHGDFVRAAPGAGAGAGDGAAGMIVRMILEAIGAGTIGGRPRGWRRERLERERRRRERRAGRAITGITGRAGGARWWSRIEPRRFASAVRTEGRGGPEATRPSAATTVPASRHSGIGPVALDRPGCGRGERLGERLEDPVEERQRSSG